jgi:hypothetical protein
MYTNIDLDHLLEAMDAWLKEHKDELLEGFPTKLIMEALKLVMKSNVFSFDNTWWKQLIGTAMGTPCACIIAMLYFGLFKRHYLLQKYKTWLLCYCRVSDNVFAIRLTNGNIRESEQAFAQFKKDIDKFGRLRWVTEDLTNSVDFLDLTIYISKRDGKCRFKTFQKALNL